MTARLRLALACGVATLLACAPLGPLFDSYRWLGYSILAVSAVTASSLIARRLSLPGALVPVINLGALALLVGSLFGGDTRLFGLLPTWGTVAAVQTQVAAAFTDIVQLAVPVPARPGLLLLTTLGVGAVAIAVDALAVSLRRAPLAGLPMLAMFAVPVAVVRTGLGWFPFSIAASGYLFLLLSEGRDRISRWGRPFAEATSGQVWRPDRLEGSPMAGVGRRIGAVAIGFAVVLPALVPFVHEGGLALIAGGNGRGPGGGSAQALNPITQLRGQLRRSAPIELLRVKTSDPSPFYLRVTTLENYTRTGWEQDPLVSANSGRVKAGLPSPDLAPDVPTKKVTTQIDVRGLGDSQYLPVYAEPTRVKVKGDWRFDRASGTVFTTRTNTRDLSYSFSSVRLDQSNPQLQDLLKLAPDADEVQQNKYGRGNVPNEPEIRNRVAKIIRGKTTQYDKTLALYDYFRDPSNGFVYSTSTEPGNSGSALLDFLNTKKGYCEQYASAMAAMARYAGVPARVAIGYTKGVHKRGYWSVTTDDAHAWVEVYFQGVGWVPWDPTPLSGQGRATTLDYASPTTPIPGSSPGTAPSPGPSGSLSAAQQQQRDNLGLRGVGPDVANPSSSAPTAPRDYALWWLAAAFCLVALTIPSLARLSIGRRRRHRISGGEPRPAAHAAWDEILALAHDLGLTLNTAETPRATAARLARQGGLDAGVVSELGVLARAEERARYSRGAPAEPALVGSVRRVRRALLAGADRRTRLRARLAPASVISAASRQSSLRATMVRNALDGDLRRIRRAIAGRIVPGRVG